MAKVSYTALQLPFTKLLGNSPIASIFLASKKRRRSARDDPHVLYVGALVGKKSGGCGSFVCCFLCTPGALGWTGRVCLCVCAAQLENKSLFPFPHLFP